jgi:hypothetical protein
VQSLKTFKQLRKISMEGRLFIKKIKMTLHLLTNTQKLLTLAQSQLQQLVLKEVKEIMNQHRLKILVQVRDTL